jgi:hypothetical protein
LYGGPTGDGPDREHARRDTHRDIRRSCLRCPSERHVFDSLQDTSCQSRRLVDTRIVEEDEAYVFRNGRLVDGKWSETWTLDRCGKNVDIRLDFEADGRGGTTFGVSLV